MNIKSGKEGREGAGGKIELVSFILAGKEQVEISPWMFRFFEISRLVSCNVEMA